MMLSDFHIEKNSGCGMANALEGAKLGDHSDSLGEKGGSLGRVMVLVER